MNQSGKKIDWVLLLSLVVIVGGIVFLVFMANKFNLFDFFLNKKNSIKNQGNVMSLETKYCGYAKKTLDWMDKTRAKDGEYAFYAQCNKEKKDCFKLIETGQNGYNNLLILWARYKYFLKTEDQEQLPIIKKDIDIYFKRSELVPIKNSFWNCRLLTEMRDEKVLKLDYVEKIDKICKTGQYLGTENIKEDENGKVIISDLVSFNWNQLKDEYLVNFKQDKKINGNYFFYVTYPSDFVSRYKVWSDNLDSDLANAYFNRLMIEYKINSTKFLPKDRCLMAVSALDLFSVNKNDKYLKWAMYIYDNYFGENEIFSEAKVPECAFFVRELAKYDNTRDYKSTQNKLLDFFIENYWDGDHNKNKITDEGGFFQITKNFVPQKYFKENALIVNLLCQ